jgi:uncharacterized metal-binding protein YceD (DUF177 family)
LHSSQRFQRTQRKQGHIIVNTSSATLLSNRVLKLNVGFLLSAGPGNKKDVELNITDPVRIADDLVANYVIGTIRMTRGKDGVLIQTDLHVGMERQCARCLEPFEHDMRFQVEELYAHPAPMNETDFFIGKDAKLDLAPLLRAEVLIELSHRKFCRENCQGLCQDCGTNLNHEECGCEADDIDPRMAKLKELLDD